MQYITVLRANASVSVYSERLSDHRSSIKKHANTFIARHFNLPGHTMDDIKIQPIEHITQSPGETEQDVTVTQVD